MRSKQLGQREKNIVIDKESTDDQRLLKAWSCPAVGVIGPSNGINVDSDALP